MTAVYITLAIFAALLALVLAGPRVNRNTEITPPQPDEDLDQWLQASESQYPDITPGAEKTIVWNDPQQRLPTDYVFVYLHGFSATRQETVPVTDKIASYFGGNIFYSRLQGHGRGQEPMAQASVNGWVRDVAEAMAIADRLGRKIVLVGCSTGATLAWWASHQARYRDKITALLLFSPNFSLYDKKARVLLWPWGERLARLLIGPYRGWEPENDRVAKYWTPRYPVGALLPMAAIVDVAAACTPEQHKVPTFMLYSNLDMTVDARVTNDYFERLNVARDRLIIDDPDAISRHVVIGDIMAPHNNRAAIDAAVNFLKGLER